MGLSLANFGYRCVTFLMVAIFGSSVDRVDGLLHCVFYHR